MPLPIITVGPVARARNGVIGVGGDLPWRISSDLKLFRKMTMGKPVITAECYDRKPGDTNRYDFLGALQHPLNATSKPQAVASGPAQRAAASNPWATSVKPQRSRAKQPADGAK